MILMLLGCNLTSDKKNGTKIDTTKIKTDSNDKTMVTDSNMIYNKTNNLKEKIWTKTYSNNRIGFLYIGDSITDAIDLLKNDFKIDFDSLACDACDDGFEYYYSFCTQKNKLVFILHPEWEKQNKDLINRFDLLNSEYKSDKGIGVGNTVKDLKEKYQLTKAFYHDDVGLCLEVDGFDGYFRLDFKTYWDYEDFNFERPEPDLVPEKSIIDKIVIR